jgi:iron uptake system EfeUOB component EfeO/EfeM
LVAAGLPTVDDAMRRRLASLIAFAGALAVVAVVAVALSPWSSGSSKHAVIATPGPNSIAPSGKNRVLVHQVYGTSLTPQQAADFTAPPPEDATRQSELYPLRVADFHKPVAKYRRYAEGQARAMATPVDHLIADLRAGDRRAARRAWSQAYSRYLLLGAAYGALGDLDVAIDGGPGGLRGGVHDPSFSGLHRIEHELWASDTATARIIPWATRLRQDVAKLPRALRTVEITPLDYATRAHEILEDAQRDQLSGVAAPWSGDGVAATAAGVQATDRVLATLRGVLRSRGDVQSTVDYEMAALRATMGAIRRAHDGRWPSLDALRSSERARLNGAMGAALEALSGVPGALETSIPPKVKPIP